MRILLCICVLTAVTSPLAARTWLVEKDGSGNFTVIQDALDACAPGDSVVVGPGRFGDFRLHTFQPSGPEIMAIMTVETTGLTVLGAGQDLTIIGPADYVEDVDGLNPACLLVELEAETDLSGFTFENVRFPVNFRHRSRITGCRINTTGTTFGLDIIEGDLVEIRDCEFFGPKGIITSSGGVTRPQIVDCRFEGSAQGSSAISIGNGATDAFISRCTIVGYPSGVSTSFGAAAVVEDCYFSQQVVSAINLDSGHITMRRCQIDAGVRFPLRVNIGLLE